MDLKQQLEINPKLQKHLFEKGFLITDADYSDCLCKYPFYDNWNAAEVDGYRFYVYKTVNAFFHKINDRTFFLIGHAYNPYTLEIDENNILRRIGEVYGKQEYFERIDELTGIFIIGSVCGNDIDFTLDASGMQYGCYGEVDGKKYISSHMRLIGDLCDLQTDDYVRRLVDYKWYHYMMGNYMPGELTCFKELKRIIPNMGGALWFLKILFFVSILYCVFDYIIAKFVHKQILACFFQGVISIVLLAFGFFLSTKSIGFLGIDRIASTYWLYAFGHGLCRFRCLYKNWIWKQYLPLLVLSYVALLILNNFGSISLNVNYYTNPFFFIISSLFGWCFLYSVSFFLPSGL